MPFSTSTNAVVMTDSHFLESYNAQLDLLRPVEGCRFEHNEWRFIEGTREVVFDFNWFDKAHTKFIDSIKVTHEDKNYNITTIELAKMAFLVTASTKGIISKNLSYFNILLLIFSFLTANAKRKVKADDWQALYIFMMTTDVDKNGISDKFSARAYGSLICQINTKKLSFLLQSLDTDVLLEGCHINKRMRALDLACKAVLGITGRDYKEGGSFNFLTLDVGRYYIDYCADFFESNYALSYALSNTLKIAPGVINEKLGKTYYLLRQKILINKVLAGEDIVANAKSLKLDPDTATGIQIQTLKVFWKCYAQAVKKNSLFQIDKLQKIAEKLKLEERFDSYEFIRSMVFARDYTLRLKSRKNILAEYCASTQTDWFDLQTFDEVCDDIQTPIKEVPLSLVWQQLGYDISRLNGVGIQHFISDVEAAGVTLFLAMTGWRKSEFGFPLSSIKIEDNNDVLDSTYTPFRFHVQWTVRKTSKDTNLDREITLSSYLVAKQLNGMVNRPVDGSPCLYSATKKSLNGKGPRSYLDQRVSRLWRKFVTNYKTFKDLDEIDKLRALEVKQSLTEEDRYTFQQFINKYPENYKTAELLWVRNKVRAELPRMCALNIDNIESNDNIEYKIFSYLKGTLQPQEHELFEQYLTNDVKEQLKNMKIITVKCITSDAKRIIRAQMMEGVAYPSPHAMRHIWAEAVLRRYRGDVGKFIKANFKHIDERFFMRYLRDKDTKAVHEIAKRITINSLVRTHLLAVRDEHREMAGRFDIFIRRIAKNTKVMSINELAEHAETFADRNVIDIKTSSWSTCILRRTTTKQAKCAKDDIPQRQNSSPKLCLGCVNGDIQEGNYIGIVIALKDHIKCCLNEKIPYFLKVESIHIIKLAKDRIYELRRNSGNDKYDTFINILTEALNVAKQQKGDLE